MNNTLLFSSINSSNNGIDKSNLKINMENTRPKFSNPTSKIRRKRISIIQNRIRSNGLVESRR